MSAGDPICVLGTQKSLRELSESKCNSCDMLVIYCKRTVKSSYCD